MFEYEIISESYFYGKKHDSKFRVDNCFIIKDFEIYIHVNLLICTTLEFFNKKLYIPDRVYVKHMNGCDYIVDECIFKILHHKRNQSKLFQPHPIIILDDIKEIAKYKLKYNIEKLNKD